MTRRTRPRRRFTRPQWAVSIAAALAVIGFIGAAQWNSSLARQEFVTSAQRVLVSEAERAQAEQERLRAELEDAEARVREFQEREAGSATAEQRLNQDVAAARFMAGLTSVAGPGVVIEIADSLEQVNDSNYLVLEDDLRDIVTALLASGAEAVAISGGGGPSERLVSTTSIYGVGVSILVNSAFLSPPFRIEAIGPEGLADRFLAHPSYITRVQPRIETYGLRFAWEPRDEIQLPPFVGNTRLRYGAPALEED